jgi:toxin ParE1/3/4
MVDNKYFLKFTHLAEKDLDEIYSYISIKLFNDQAAVELMDRIENAIKQLKEFPFSSPIASDKTLKKRGYRKLIVDNYIAFYQVDKTEMKVTIMRILYGARKYQDLL